MDYFDLIEKRHSVRSFKGDDIEDGKLQKILEAARLAPTAVNKQAFKIFVIHTKGKEDVLKNIYSKDWFVKAPIIIGVCSMQNKSWVRRDGVNYGFVDAAIVMDHIVLAATSLGLGACWIGAFDVSSAKKYLNLEEGIEPVAFTPIGYEDKSSYKKIRKDIDEIVTYL
jgi:nitroreductase